MSSNVRVSCPACKRGFTYLMDLVNHWDNNHFATLGHIQEFENKLGIPKPCVREEVQTTRTDLELQLTEQVNHANRVMIMLCVLIDDSYFGKRCQEAIDTYEKLYGDIQVKR